MVRRAWRSRGDSFLEGRQGETSAFAGFSLSRFYSTQAPSVGDGATHSEDESSQPFVSLLCKHPHPQVQCGASLMS